MRHDHPDEYNHPLVANLTRRTLLGSAAGATAAVLSPVAIRAQTPEASPEASRVAASGITWPDDHALPTFAEAGRLAVTNIGGLADVERTLFVSMQGIVNRSVPRVYLEQPRDEGEYTWLNDGLGLEWDEIDDPWELFAQFSGELSGIVVTDPALTSTVNVATTIAGLEGAAVADPALVATLAAAPFNLTVIDDLQGRFTTDLEAYTWQFETLWPRVNQRMLIGIDPEGVFGELRDYAVANTTMPFWLESNVPEERDLFVRIMESVAPYTPYLGWFAQDVAGEFSGTQLCSEHSVFVLAADWCVNWTVWSGTRADTPPLVEPPHTMEIANRIYVTFVVSEGDNLQYNQHKLRVLWEDPARGSVPVNWTTNPLLIDCAPAMWDWYARSATANDLMMVGPSGAGYMNPGVWPDETFDLYTQRTGEYMRRTGMTTIYVLNRADGKGIDLSEAEVASYLANAAPRGIALNWETFSETIVLPGGLPQSVVDDAGTVEDLQAAIANAAVGWDGNSPLFVTVGVLAWELGPTQIKQVADSLDDTHQLVRADHFFDLVRAAAQGDGTPVASPSATPVS